MRSHGRRADDRPAARVRQDRGVPTLTLTQDTAADELLSRDPLALLLGMLFDQQFPMERAFAGPRLLADRLGVDRLDAAALAAEDPERLAKAFQGPPAGDPPPGPLAPPPPGEGRPLLERHGGR